MTGNDNNNWKHEDRFCDYRLRWYDRGRLMTWLRVLTTMGTIVDDLTE
jgi:hypothetical protein